jgi:formyltetrahydrofolate deformylase
MDLVATLTCDDRPGIVHAITSAILECDGNILENQQFTDPRSNTFVMRTRFLTESSLHQVAGLFDSSLARFSPSITLRESSTKKRALVAVSKESHCLRDLLYLHEIGELPIEIPIVISNHPDLRTLVESHGITFKEIDFSPTTREKSETEITALIEEKEIDFVVLARFMQVLSFDFCSRYQGKIINIHHSFLPSFKGAKPYHQAFDKGVKIIGATAHFVTADLDEGPIIEQDVAHIDHSATLEEMISLGRDIERRVLARAVRWYAEDRIFEVNGRTIVFH